jgi:hypothetical protein
MTFYSLSIFQFSVNDLVLEMVRVIKLLAFNYVFSL